MTDKRKPTALKRSAVRSTQPELVAFKERYEQLEKLLKSKKLNTQFIAFEAIASILGAAMAGHSEADVLEACPEAWGKETVAVPASLLKALVDVWLDYKDAGPGITLGEAFGLEGGGQGRRPLKDRQATRDRRRSLANLVEIEYRLAEINGSPISQETAIEVVALNNNAQHPTVQAAFKEYKNDMRSALARNDMLEDGGKKLPKSTDYNSQ